MKVTVELTPEQEEFLKMFATNQAEGSRDNVETNKPLHIVQTQILAQCVEDQRDCVIWYDVAHEYAQYDSIEGLVQSYYYDKPPIPIVTFDEAYFSEKFIGVNGVNNIIFCENDYLEAYGIDPDVVHKIHGQYQYRDVAYFWILAEAKRYIQYQGHNLKNPRTYTVDGGYSNKSEYEHFYDLLMGLGEQIIDGSA